MKSIRTKLWLGMMILVGIIIVLLWLFQIMFLDQFYSALKINELSKQMDSIISDFEQLTDINQLNETDDLINSIRDFIYEEQISAQISDKSNKVIYEVYSSSNMNIPRIMQEMVSELTAQTLIGKEAKGEVTHPKFGYKFMIIAKPVYIEKSIQGTMLIILPMASMKDTTDILKKQLILITIILLFVSIIISLQLSRKFTRPILEISRAAESYSGKQYDVRIKQISKDEIGQLADRMNYMGEALGRNEVLQKELIANVSHELRTPLAIIRGYAETLRDVTGANPEKREKQLGVIIEETERLSSIVEDILNLSRLQSGAISLDQEAFLLQDMVSGVLKRYTLQVQRRQFKVKGLEELKEQLLGDKKKLEQVFYNLINNAVHHTEEDGVIEIVVSQEKDKVRIEIIDNGEGIAEEDLKHIFERYNKGIKGGDRKTNGTGLGLAIVKNILELHKVFYGVKSELGKGTTFWFELNKVNS